MLEGESKRKYKRRSRGAPKTRREIQRDFVARKKLTHSRLDVLIPNETKKDLDFLVDLYGKSRSEIIDELIKNAKSSCGFDDRK